MAAAGVRQSRRAVPSRTGSAGVILRGWELITRPGCYQRPGQCGHCRPRSRSWTRPARGRTIRTSATARPIPLSASSAAWRRGTDRWRSRSPIIWSAVRMLRTRPDSEAAGDRDMAPRPRAHWGPGRRHKGHRGGQPDPGRLRTRRCTTKGSGPARAPGPTSSALPGPSALCGHLRCPGPGEGLARGRLWRCRGWRSKRRGG